VPAEDVIQIGRLFIIQIAPGGLDNFYLVELIQKPAPKLPKISRQKLHKETYNEKDRKLAFASRLPLSLGSITTLPH